MVFIPLNTTGWRNVR